MSDLKAKIKSLPTDRRDKLVQLIKQKQKARRVHRHFDVVILGGGLAGLTLARQLKRADPAMDILVTEKRQHPVPEAAHKVGESTVELGTYYLREVLDLKEHLDTYHLPKAGLRYYFSARDNSDIAQRVELGSTIFPPTPSHQIDRGRFENMLRQINISQNITCWDNCTVQSIDLEEPKHLITMRRDGREEIISARWIIDASGRASLLKRQLDLGEVANHSTSAVWFRLNEKVDIDTWSNDLSWTEQVPRDLRWYGTNHLMARGYWVWLIPLGACHKTVNGTQHESTSFGIVADHTIHPHSQMNRFERALDWLKHHEPQCASVVEDRQHLLQDFCALRHYAHGCKQLFSSQRWALTGEAGVFVDPFYSPGTDFIGMNNSLITDLVMRDLRGEAIQQHVAFYNQSFINTFKSFLSTYQNQYPLMGHPQVMTAKIIWDWACYWGVTTLLFFHDNKLFDLNWAQSMQPTLLRFHTLYLEMQTFFNQWKNKTPQVWEREFVNIGDFPVMEELHHRLLAERSDDETLKALIKDHVALLESIADQCRTANTMHRTHQLHYFGPN